MNGPEANGCETAAELLTFLPQCRVAIFSGSRAAVPVIEEYRLCGYDFDVLAKPLHPQDLLNWLRSHKPPAPEPADSFDNVWRRKELAVAKDRLELSSISCATARHIEYGSGVERARRRAKP